MNRDGLIRALRRYCRKRKIAFEVDEARGKGGHYLVTVGQTRTTVQSSLTENRIRSILKQLGVDPADL